MASSYLESLKQYVGFDDASTQRLRAFHPIAEPHFRRIIDDFYAAIEAHPGASASITGGAAQIARLKQTLMDWIDGLLRGPHDEAYFERRARIGRVHVRISLPQAYMFTAMDRIRVQLLDVAETQLASDLDTLRATTLALNQILDIELAIMLETYREDLMARSATAERLATLGQFASGIGHELRNPLGIMESSLFLLRQHLARLGVEDPKVVKHLDKIAVELRRSDKTINDLLDLARNRAPRRQTVPVTAVVQHALTATPLPEAVSIETSVPEGATVDADPDQLAQLLSNLFVNASQAMNGAGVIRVQAWREDDATGLRVRDGGPGVPSEIRHRVFEALFTTKAKGTGLGLALCRSIAEAHGGTIQLEAATDGGASFVVVIPDANAAPRPAR